MVKNTFNPIIGEKEFQCGFFPKIPIPGQEHITDVAQCFERSIESKISYIASEYEIEQIAYFKNRIDSEFGLQGYLFGVCVYNFIAPKKAAYNEQLFYRFPCHSHLLRFLHPSYDTALLAKTNPIGH